MSLTPAPVGVLLLLQQHGLLAEVNSAYDFGSMEFDSRAPENNKPYEVFFERQGKSMPTTFYDVESGRLYGVAGDMYRALGWNYASFDIDGRWGSIPIDLNLEHVPPDYREGSALTMNIGTSEHVFNQYNFFLQFHNVTRVGGLMFHVVPFNNYQNHGLYQYCPTFFLSLARYNKYDVLGFWQTGKPDYYQFHSGHAKPVGTRTTLHCVLRRTSEDEFRFPLQVNEPMLLNNAAEAWYGVFEKKQLDEIRPSGPLPREFYLNVADATVTPGIPAATPEGAPLKNQGKELKRQQKELKRQQKELKRQQKEAKALAQAVNTEVANQ